MKEFFRTRYLVVFVALTCGVFFSIFFYRVTTRVLHGPFVRNFAAQVKDINGTDTRVLHERSRVTLVYFWASWCPYCANEIKTLSLLKKQYGSKISIVAINRGEPTVEAQAFVTSLSVDGISFVLNPGDTLFKEFEGFAMPENILIDRHGGIILHQHGPFKDGELAALLTTLLK